MPNVLVLGGTSEASALAHLLAKRGLPATLSYAGRTTSPRAQPVPSRVGGFGGAEGLAGFLRRNAITHLVDATHPFAAAISANAVEAARIAGVPHLALTRPAWSPGEGDRWRHVPDIAGAVTALDGSPQRIMLALGRMHVEAFAARPQHHYLLRFVDMPTTPPSLPRHEIVVDRGPFTTAGDIQLMEAHGTELLVCKNAGGSGAEAKLIAARRLSLPVLMIDRPPLPCRREVYRPEDVMNWLGHAPGIPAERGV